MTVRCVLGTRRKAKLLLQIGDGRPVSYTGRVLQIYGLLLFFLPAVAFGQEREVQTNVEVHDSPLLNSDVDTGRQNDSDFVVMLSGGVRQSLGAEYIDMGGVDMFRIPEQFAHDYNSFADDGLIGPVRDLNSGIVDQKTGEQKEIRWQFGDTHGLSDNAPISITILEGNSKTFPVSLESQPSGNVTVTITGYEGRNLTVDPEVLIFTTETWDVSQTVTLTAEEDNNAINEAAIRLTFTNPGGVDTNPDYVNVTIVDNEIEWELVPRQVKEGSAISVSIPLASTRVPLLDALAPPTGDVVFRVSGYQDQGIIPFQTTLRFPLNNWMQNQVLNLQTTLDDGYGDEDVKLTLTASGGGYNGLKYTVAITIIDQPEERLVPEGGEITLEYTLSLVGDPEIFVPRDFTVTWEGHQGTDLTVDQVPNDFLASSWYKCEKPSPQGPLIETWCTEVGRTTMSAAEDPDTDDDLVVLRMVLSAQQSLRLPNPQVNVTIQDNDDPGLEITPPTLTVNEGGTETFEVKLSAPPSDGIGNDVTITMSSLRGEDRTVDLETDPAVLFFTAGNWNENQTVKVRALDDPDSENENEVIFLEASGGGFDFEHGRVSVTILDDDLPGLNAEEIIEVDEGDSEPLNISLKTRPSGNVAVIISGYHGTDLTPRPPILTFTQTNWDEIRQVTLFAAHDPDFEEDTVPLTLSARGGGYVGEVHHIQVTIKDDDKAGIIAPETVTVMEGDSEIFNVSLQAAPLGNVTVRLSEFRNRDLTRDIGTLTFTPSNWAHPQEVRVFAAEDPDAEPDRGALTLTAMGGGYNEVLHTVTVTVQDNDVKGIVLTPSSLSLEEEGPPGMYTVRLRSEPTEDVTVRIAVEPTGTNLLPDQTSLNFTDANWGVPQTVTLSAGKDDNLLDESVTLTHTAFGGGYDNVVTRLNVFVKDKGEVPLTLSIHDASVNEQDEEVNLLVELNREAKELVSVLYQAVEQSAEAEADYDHSRGIMLFEPGSTKGRIRIKIVDDELKEPEETFAVVLSSARHAQIARSTGRVTILDNDLASTAWIDDEMAVDAEGMMRFTVHLSEPCESPVSVNYRTENGTATAGEDYHTAAGTVTFAPGMIEQKIVVELLPGGLYWPEETFTVHLEQSSDVRLEKAVGVGTIRGGGGTVNTKLMKAYTARFVRTSTVQVVDALQQRFRSQSDGSSCSVGQRAELVQVWGTATDWNPSLGEFLAGCHMSQEQPTARGIFRVWGQGAFTRFNGRGEEALNVRGDVTTAMLGADYRVARGWLAGVLVSHSQGDGSFGANAGTGEVQAGLTGMVPYVSIQGTDWGAWLAAGYGRGRAEIQKLEGDLVATFGAAGVQGEWVAHPSVGLTVHGDVLVAGSEIDEYALSMRIYRVRAGLEADLRVSMGIRPYVVANVRQDGGSAETGTGLELGGGIRFSYPAWRLKGEVRTQGLVMHTVNGFTEWGMSGLVQVGGRSDGLMVSVRPSWGPRYSGVLHHHQSILDVVPARTNLHRTEMEMAYGIPLKSGVVRPLMGVTQFPTGRMYRMGTELWPRGQVSVSIFGLAHAHANSQREIGLNVQGSMRY